jgi:DNA polymerase-3 subunit delta'
LINREEISPNMAQFAAKVSQGHIGRARYLATNEAARSNRKVIMQVPMQLGSLASALQAAQTLVDIATEEARVTSESRDEIEIEKLQEAYGKGATGRGMATGGSKAVKELEKEQKSRATRMVRDSIDGALLDLATFYRDVMMVQSGSAGALINSHLFGELASYSANSPASSSVKKLDAIMETRGQLAMNAAPLATCEALMCRLAQP